MASLTVKKLASCARFIDRLNEWVGFGVSWLTAALVLVTCTDVFTRKILNTSSVKVADLVWHLFAAIFLLGAAYTLKHDKHVRVDVIYAKLGKRAKAWINLAGVVVFLLLFCFIVIWVSVPNVLDSFELGEESETGGLPARYVIWACIPLGLALLFFQGVSLGLRSLLTLLEKESGPRERRPYLWALPFGLFALALPIVQHVLPVGIPPGAMPLVLFGVLFALLMVGFPVAFTLGGVAMVFGLVEGGPDAFELYPLRVQGVMQNEFLIAVPLFIFMGLMLQKSKIAEELLENMGLLFGRMRGGLAISVIVVGTLLAASTGIVGATVVTMGVLSLPTMLKRGYSPELATGTISASGTLGQIIPPSIVLVLLGSILREDIGSMFKAAVIPGFLLVVLYMVWIGVLAIFRPSSVPAMPAEELAEFRRHRASRLFHALLPPILLMMAVLGSIFAGIATPTEAAGVGALGATILALVRGRFGASMFREVMAETTKITCMVFIILVSANAFTLVFRDMEGDAMIASAIEGAGLGPQGFLLLVMGVVFVAGFFIDFIEITFIIVPIVEPLFRSMGMDMTWIGILLALNLQTSFMTPPFGFSLFYLKGVAPPEVKTVHLYKGIIPFIVIQLLCLALVYFFPEAALWLTR